MTLIKISKEEINLLPQRAYEGEVVMITDSQSCLKAIDEILEYKILGLDTEAKPSFKKGDNFTDSLIQIATDEKVYLFRVKLFKVPQKFTRILESPEIVKTGVAIKDDVKGIKKIIDFNDANFIDLARVAKEKNVGNFGLRSMAAAILGFRISKGAKLTNWEARTLTPTQISYAATDAWVSLLLYKKLKSM